jgi:hypothetical protein
LFLARSTPILINLPMDGPLFVTLLASKLWQIDAAEERLSTSSGLVRAMDPPLPLGLWLVRAVQKAG